MSFRRKNFNPRGFGADKDDGIAPRFGAIGFVVGPSCFKQPVYGETCGAYSEGGQLQLQGRSSNPRTARSKHWKYWAVLYILISLSTFVDAVLAQQAEPDSYSGFEGRKVERLEITARTDTDAESFRPLIRQKQDQALSMEAIRESVATLQQTTDP